MEGITIEELPVVQWFPSLPFCAIHVLHIWTCSGQLYTRKKISFCTTRDIAEDKADQRFALREWKTMLDKVGTFRGNTDTTHKVGPWKTSKKGDIRGRYAGGADGVGKGKMENHSRPARLEYNHHYITRRFIRGLIE